MDEEIYQNGSPIVALQTISGCTCLEYDRLFVLTDKPLLNIGDRIVYHNVGAYTMCLSPMFIRYIPNIYAMEKGNANLSVKNGQQKSIYKKQL